MSFTAEGTSVIWSSMSSLVFHWVPPDATTRVRHCFK